MAGANADGVGRYAKSTSLLRLMTTNLLRPDWAAIHYAYRAGLLSLRSIGATHGVTAAGILKRAKREGWQRDLAPAIRVAANVQLQRQAVNTGNTLGHAPERRIIAENAQMQVDVVVSHRRRVAQAMGILRQLVEELSVQTANIDALRNFAAVAAEVKAGMRDAQSGIRVPEVATCGQETRFAQAHGAFLAAISLYSRAQVLHRLADSLRTLVAIEREAFGISDRHEDGTRDVVAALRELSGQARL